MDVGHGRCFIIKRVPKAFLFDLNVVRIKGKVSGFPPFITQILAQPASVLAVFRERRVKDGLLALILSSSGLEHLTYSGFFRRGPLAPL